MPRVHINIEEQYPVYDIDDAPGLLGSQPVEVDDATLARWLAAFEAYQAVQKEMREAHTPAWAEAERRRVPRPSVPPGAVAVAAVSLWCGTLAAWLRDGPALVRQGPVARVEITDRQPKKHEQPGGLCHWHWVGCDLGAAPPFMVYVAHPTEQDALDALSAACLAWARAQEVKP